MLNDATVKPMLPVSDLAAAETFYEKTLGLEKVDGMPGVAVTYRSGKGTLNVYRSDYAGTNQGTAALFEVDDVESTARELKGKGVTFESYDLPGMTRKGDVHFGGRIKVAWFKDPSGNILSIQNRPDDTGKH